MKAKKLVRRSKPNMASRPALRTPRRKAIKVHLGRFGADVQELRLPAGATVKDLVKAQGLEELSIRINGNTVRLSTQLRDGDLVTAVPALIVGAGFGCGRTSRPRARGAGGPRLGRRSCSGRC